MGRPAEAELQPEQENVLGQQRRRGERGERPRQACRALLRSGSFSPDTHVTAFTRKDPGACWCAVSLAGTHGRCLGVSSTVSVNPAASSGRSAPLTPPPLLPVHIASCSQRLQGQPARRLLRRPPRPHEANVPGLALTQNFQVKSSFMYKRAAWP